MDMKPNINHQVTEAGFQLVKAAERGRLADVKQALSDGASSNAWVFFGVTAAMMAAQSGACDCLAAMIDQVDLSIRDDKGDTVLMKAEAAGCETCVRLLKARTAST